MSVQKVAFKLKEQSEATEVEYDFGDTLEEGIEKFGKEVIWNRAKSALVIDLQALGRRLIEFNADPKNKDKQKDIQAEAAAWKPDVRNVVRRTAGERAQDAIASMSQEEKAKLLAQLQAQLG